MEEEEQVSIKNAETKLDKKRGRTPFIREGKSTKARLWMPTVCHAAIFRLQEELGLASGGEAIHWLIRQARPELLPASQPLPLRYRKKGLVHNSVPRPACLSDRDGDTQKSNFQATTSGRLAVRTPVMASVVQASTVFFDTPATLDKAEKLIACAAAYGSQLVVFPEAFIGGYPRCVKFDATAAAHSTETDHDLQKYHACAIDVPGPEVDRLAKIAGKYKVHLVVGVVERAGFYLYSTVLYFDSLGRHLGKHRKVMQMALERAVWYAGDKSSLPVYETSIGKIGGLICWDNKLPLLRTELYDKGVEMYCAPTADAGEIWKASMTHIAVEGGCFVLSANQFCRRRDYPLPPGDSNADVSLDSITCAGGSVIISPSGAILAGPNYQGECLISADLDLGDITKAKTQFGGVKNNVGRNNVGLAANKSDPFQFATEIKMEAP